MADQATKMAADIQGASAGGAAPPAVGAARTAAVQSALQADGRSAGSRRQRKGGKLRPPGMSSLTGTHT